MSMPTVGSSSSSTCGSPSSAIAKRTRWDWPPERALIRLGMSSAMSAPSTTSAIGIGCACREWSIRSMVRTLWSGSSAPACSIVPISPVRVAVVGSVPSTRTLPCSGVASPTIISMAVDFPAPFGPSSATISPGRISRSSPSRARTSP